MFQVIARPAAVLVALVLIAGCTGVIKSASGTAVIDESFNVTGYRWTGGGTVYIFASARDKGGQTELCAAWAPDQMDAYSARLNDQAIEALMFRAENGGDTLARGGGFMNKLLNPLEVEGRQANCVMTGTAWNPVYAEGVQVKTGRGRFVY